MPAEEIHPGLWKSGVDRFPADSQAEADRIAVQIGNARAERDPAVPIIRDRLVQREGFLALPTEIGDGVLTIGYGHNLDARPWTNSQREFLRLDAGREFAAEPLTNEEGLAILDSDIMIDIDAVKGAMPGRWRELSPVRRASLGELAHITTNVGGFAKMIGAVNAALDNPQFAPELFQRAGTEISDSDLGRGIASNGALMRGNIRRANELALMMQTDQVITLQDQDPRAFVPLFQQGLP